MIVRIASDLHIDSHKGVSIDACTGCDLEIIAGDWANGDYLRRHGWPTHESGALVVGVLGNHEWWQLDERAQRDIHVAPGMDAGIRILERERIEFDGWTILGCTLWTDFELYGDWAHSAELARQVIADFRCIRVGGASLEPAHVRGMFARDKIWLEQELSRSNPERTIVVTHFAPHESSCHTFYDRPGSRELNPYFASNTGLVERFQPRLWVHGHTHARVDYTVGRTRVICNPRGYLGELQPDNGRFDPDLTVRLEGPR